MARGNKKPISPLSPQAFRFRLAVVFVGLTAFFCLAAVRLIQLQVLRDDRLSELARRQFEKVGKTATYRLPILDRNGEELAVSVPAVSVFARPRLITDPYRTAVQLAQVLGGPPSRWLRPLRSGRSFVWIQRQVDADKANVLSEKKLPGIFFEPENKRVYPNGKLAAHVLGFTDIDGNGLAGIELELERTLASQESVFSALRDGRGNPSYIGKSKDKFGAGRKGVYLTLDRRLQYVLEEELERTFEETKAKGAIGIIMDPGTGEVLAIAQRPTFDPNRRNEYPSSFYANRAIAHRYEPGSTMKVLFAAEAVQEGIFRPDSVIDCGGGRIQVGRTWLTEADATHKWDTLTLGRIIEYSSNVGSVRVAQALGAARVRAAIDRFGFTSRTGIELPGEATSSARGDRDWTPLLLATVGFGQGIAVTPLQMVASYAPFANGGFWVRPRILAEEGESEDELDLRRVLSATAVEKVLPMLVAVTEGEKGSGRAAKVPGVQVAGKTGTAQKYVAGEGYRGGKYFSSFIGFLPAQQPELLIGVMVDEPTDKYYASQVAAPLFGRVAERSLQILGKLPKIPVAVTPTPPLPSTKPLQEVPFLRARGPGLWEMPDLTGLSMRDSLRILGSRISRISVKGNGYVTGQAPAPGTVLSEKSRVSLRFEPASTPSG